MGRSEDAGRAGQQPGAILAGAGEMTDLISKDEAWRAVRDIICSQEWTDCDGDFFCDTIERAIRALPAAPEVKVKPLVWRQYGDAGLVALSDITGRQYTIFPSVGREGEFAMRGCEGRGYTYHLSIESAQVAAQEHHAARILAALEGGEA